MNTVQPVLLYTTYNTQRKNLFHSWILFKQNLLKIFFFFFHFSLAHVYCIITVSAWVCRELMTILKCMPGGSYCRWIRSFVVVPLVIWYDVCWVLLIPCTCCFVSRLSPAVGDHFPGHSISKLQSDTFCWTVPIINQHQAQVFWLTVTGGTLMFTLPELTSVEVCEECLAGLWAWKGVHAVSTMQLSQLATKCIRLVVTAQERTMCTENPLMYTSWTQVS